MSEMDPEDMTFEDMTFEEMVASLERRLPDAGAYNQMRRKHEPGRGGQPGAEV
jgi:hypothetical protein